MTAASYVIYSDGSCLGNPGPGAWAFVIFYDHQEIDFFCGHQDDTTNNQMEMTAALEALKWLKKNDIAECEICTDSQYLRQGLLEWMPNWKMRGWKTAQGHPVKNREIWESIDSHRLGLKIKWSWVKGHSSDLKNQRVDKIARECALKVQGSKNV